MGKLFFRVSSSVSKIVTGRRVPIPCAFEGLCLVQMQEFLLPSGNFPPCSAQCHPAQLLSLGMAGYAIQMRYMGGWDSPERVSTDCDICAVYLLALSFSDHVSC